MKTTTSKTKPDAAVHSIRSVVRLTGLSAHLLRIWEKRYAAVLPTRTKTQRRLYSEADIERFISLKTLTDQGHAIGQVAGLPTAKLQELLREDTSRSTPFPVNVTNLRLILCGEEWVAQENPLALEGIELVAVTSSLGELATMAPCKADILLLEEPHPEITLATTLAGWVQKLQLKRVILIYRFAPGRVLARLKKTIPSLCVLRAPVSNDEIRLACVQDLKAPTPAAPLVENESGIPTKLFSSAELERVVNLPTSLACECPKHLAELIRSLASFETYSANCASRDAEDAALHQRLRLRTAQARVMMEEALRDLVAVEGLG